MNKISRLLLLGLFLIAQSSCKKDKVIIDDPIEETFAITTKKQHEARTKFAQILSKAIYSEAKLREFIKKVALEQFDNDYDVFYPYVKDNIISNGTSFRDIILKYSESEEELNQIEQTLPLLNIYVPDLTMVSDFNAEKWNTSENEISVTSLNNSSQQIFFENGIEAFSLVHNEIPGFPCLVIKDNERLVQKIKVKGGSDKDNYDFLDPVFDRKINTKGSITVNGMTYGYHDSNIINPNLIVEQAFNEFGIDANYWQRDYIYWGLSKTKPKNGTFNPQIREYIHKIRINPNLLTTISDQPSDPKLNSFQVKSNDKNPVSWEDMVKRVWTDGNFELRFYIYKGKRNGNTATTDLKTLNISPRELFTINKIKHAVKGGGLFHRDRHTYSVESINDLEGKWITPDIQLEKWDISEESMTMTIAIEEYDPSETREHTLTVTNKYASEANFKIGVGIPINEKIKLDLSFGASSQKETTKLESTKWVTTYASDNLGNVTFYFSDPILRYNYYKDVPSVKIFEGYSVSTGGNKGIDIMLLPKRI